MPAAVYLPADNLDTDTDNLYTLADLRKLLRHWGEPDAIRELADGRVVHVDWSPTDGDPVVLARRVRVDPTVGRGTGSSGQMRSVGTRLNEEQHAEVMAAVEALEADGMTRSDAYRELLLRGAWSVTS